MPTKNSLLYRKQRTVGRAVKKKGSENKEINKKARKKGARNETKTDGQT
jgi:hypothetical protein